MKPLLLSLLLGVTLWADAHVFVYHRFDDSRYPSTNTTKEELKREFEYFKTNNYEVVSLEVLVKALKDKVEIPDNWVVLTIDDNFKSFYANGLPLFQEYNYPFTLFVYVEATQKKYPDYLNWDDLRDIAKYGSLEFHSYGHQHLTYISDEEIKKDFDQGLALFFKELHSKPKFFTYPYGEFSPRVKELVKSYGFEAIINQNMGAVSILDDVYDIDRSALVGQTNLKYYLRQKSLKAHWIEPKEFPENGILESLHVETTEAANNGEVYITGYNWMPTKLYTGDFNVTLNKKLLNERTRVIVSVENKISTKLLIKDSYGTK